MKPTHKKKLLIILSSDIFIRNYLTTDAFSELDQLYDCFFLADERIVHRDKLLKKEKFIGFYKIDKVSEERYFRVFNVLMYKYRTKSSSFQFRIKRGYRTMWKTDPQTSFLNKIRFLTESLLFNIKLKSFFLIYSNPVSFPFFKKLYIYRLPLDSNLARIFEEIKPDLAIFPSSAYDPVGMQIVRICNLKKIKSLFLIDNWDNLSSKSIMWEKPDYLGVWGQQSVEHGIRIQGISRDRIETIGTPRFDSYFNLRDVKINSHFRFRYILFVGTALPFDEVGALQMINSILEKNSEIFKDTMLVYRPHPWRQGKDSIIGKDFSKVIIDPQMLETYASKNNDVNVQPDVGYYPSLLKNAELIIGGLTTMIIEGLIFRKKVMALVHNDNKSLTSPHNIIKYYVHFQGIQNLQAIHFCHDLNNLEHDLIRIWNSRLTSDASILDSERNYYLYNDEKPYRRRLSDFVTRILSNND